MELIRQPVLLLLVSASAIFIVFLSGVSYFGLGEDQKMVKDMALAVSLLSGLLGAVLTASSSVAREIRSGTALAVMAKPVGRTQFILAKFTGLVAALSLMWYVNLVACLLASRTAFDAYGEPDVKAMFTFYGFVALAYAIGGFTNFFLRRPFVSDTVFALIVLVTIAFLLICTYTRAYNYRPGQALGADVPFADGVDWRLIPVMIMILFSIWVLASLALACSTKLEVVPTLAVCSGFFLIGLMSDYIFGRASEQGSVIGTVLYAVVPNWQQFWMADTLGKDRSGVPFGHVMMALAYTAAYTGAALCAALYLFEDRELS